MSSEYSYDDQGQFFPFFALTISGLITLPLTYTLVRPTKEEDKTAPPIKSGYKTNNSDVVNTLRQAQKRKQRRVKRVLVVILGWAIMAAMVYLILVTQRSVPKIWNPYDILGIADSATEKQIKSHYKRLSVKYHPDKVKPDPAKNETIESMNDFYVELTKAYQALTDEEVRNNYIQYGHPDGKQSFSMGIALPKLLVSDGNGKYVVLLYTVLLGVMLPYVVGSWWYGTKRMSKEGVLMESANALFKQYDENIEEGGVIAATSAAQEYKQLLKGNDSDSSLSKIESRIMAPGETTQYACGFSQKDKNKLEDLESGSRRKALALLWAYLGRVELDDAGLTKAKYEVAPIARAMRDSFMSISLAFGNVLPLMSSFSASQHIVQAMTPRSSALLQLPHFTPKIAAAVQGDSKRPWAVQKFMDMPDAERRALAVGNDLLSEEQYKEAVNVGKQLPYLRIAKAFFKVTGEKYVLPSSLVTLVIKGRIVPPGSENVPAVNELDLEDVDPAEDDLAAISGKGKKTIKGPDGKPVTVDEKLVSPHLAFAPHYPREVSPIWYAFLTDTKQGKIAVPPFPFAKFDQPAFDDDGKPTFNMQTLKAQFAAPPKADEYKFILHVVCDSYVGFDTRMEISLVVDEASKAAQITAEDEISEPEEDSIAGQMHALKTGQAPAASKPRRKQADDSDEESGTDDEEDDTSATNTDTEDES